LTPGPHLDGLDLLRHGRQHPLLETVELVEAAPSAHLAEADEDAAHGLKSIFLNVAFFKSDTHIGKAGSVANNSIEWWITQAGLELEILYLESSLDRRCLVVSTFGDHWS
jgi:hypothetical protein